MLQGCGCKHVRLLMTVCFLGISRHIARPGGRKVASSQKGKKE